ncbi:hypothetical protein HPB49_005228 [Dermacentor silvarum]|uniref:Uncharacterized protein n=1 Tax=Dermacentor silvarum TaxID=543639 RepID=A0ACB8D370_DERSI|nr:hypothetical protein HPB49_005228 [Dermacentor silvarum]
MTSVSYAEPCADLSVARPSRSLLTAANLSSLLLQLLLVVLGQVGVLQLLQSQSWYEYPSHDPEEDVYDYWDVATLFFLTCYQYVVTALVFTRGPPFQKPFWTNYWFLGNLLVIFTVTTILLFQTCPVIVDFFEMYIVKSTVLKNLYTRLFPESALKTRYEQVEEMVREEPDWLLSNATMVTQMTNFDIF